MAFRASRIAPGFEPDWIVVEVTLGLLASAAWLALVRWRVSRQPPMIWRAVVLSCGGLVLAWFLLMTLWLPAFNERNTYRDVAQRAAQSLPEGYDCVDVRSLGARAARDALLLRAAALRRPRREVRLAARSRTPVRWPAPRRARCPAGRCTGKGSAARPGRALPAVPPDATRAPGTGVHKDILRLGVAGVRRAARGDAQRRHRHRDGRPIVGDRRGCGRSRRQRLHQRSTSA